MTEGEQPGAWRRLHPLSPLLRGGIVFIVVAGVLAANLRDRIIALVVPDAPWQGSGNPGAGDPVDFLVERELLTLALVALLVLVLLIVFFSWLGWRFHSYRITDEAVEARSGVLVRQHRRAPLERIQSVNLQRPLLARVLGLTQVDVQTAGQGGKVALSYLSHRDAQLVREQILQQAAATPGSATSARGVEVGEASDAAPGGSFDLRRRLGEFAAPDIEPAAWSSGTLVAVPLPRLIGSILLGWEVITVLVLIAAVIVSSVVWQPLALSALVPIGLAGIGMAFRQLNRGFGFTLSRSADAVRVGAGLTSTRTETVPLDRVHAVEAKQPLAWRIFGWWQVRVTTAGHTAADGGQGGFASVVLPVGLAGDAVEVLRTLLPRIGEAETLHDDLVGSGDGYLRAGPRAGWVLWWARGRTGMRLSGGEADGIPDTLRIRRGAITRALSIVPIARVQSVQFRRPLVHRGLGLAAVQAHTVLGPVHTEMRGIALLPARTAFDRLARAVVLVQGGETAPGPRRTA